MISQPPDEQTALPPELVVPLSAEFVEALAACVARSLQPAPHLTEPWIGVRDAAEHLACNPARVYELVSQGRLLCRRDGRRLLFRRSELDGYLESAAG